MSRFYSPFFRIQIIGTRAYILHLAKSVAHKSYLHNAPRRIFGQHQCLATQVGDSLLIGKVDYFRRYVGTWVRRYEISLAL